MNLTDFFTIIKLPFLAERELYCSLRRKLGFWPRRIAPYRLALTHKSLAGHKGNNERLEFLGDAILGAVVADIVYRHFPNKPEGFLTNTRSKIVQRESMNHIAQEMGLERLIKSDGHTHNAHNSYVGGNALEALVGAIYLDRGYAHCMRFVERRIINRLVNIDKVAASEQNFKSKLIEWSQKHKVRTEFALIEESKEHGHTPTFVSRAVLNGIPCGTGKGYSKRESQQAAARATLNRLRRDRALAQKILSPQTLAALAAILTVSCANIGSPDGGRYDEEPPVVVSSTPANKAVNVRGQKVSINFNEYIKLESASEKVVISPPQNEQPNVRAVNKAVKVDLYDTLLPNTTYTIDFADAIVDNNESNPMGKYTFSFSTGPTIDTMEVSGTVLNAEDLEPVKSLLVGLYPADSAWSDTLFTSLALTRVGRTNGSGQFTIKGIKEGAYRAFALKDMDNNYYFSQKSEIIAWDTTTIRPWHKPDIRPDTIWRDTATIEKIVMRPFIHYYPDDLVLLSFTEEGQDRHLLKTERKGPDNFTLYFTAPQDSLPLIQGIGFDGTTLLPEPSLHNDTITYWITDTAAAHADTLAFAITYLDTDTTGIDLPRTDTLELVPKTPWAKLEKERQKKIEDWEKEREKKMKRAKEPLPNERNPYEMTFLQMKTSSNSIAPNQNITLTFDEPIAHADTSKIHFQIKVDTLYVDEPFLLEQTEGKQREFVLYAEWMPTKAYRLTTDSTAFVSALGKHTKETKTDIRVRSEDEFGTIFVKLKGDDPNCIVQLLDKSDKAVSSMLAEGGRADFFYLKPGDYYLRLIVDRNANGKWDTGEYATQTQPEEVFYFPQPIPVRAKFEIEQEWDYRGIERTKQKPKEITKQKADKEKTIKNRNAEREEEKKNGKKKSS